MLVFENNIQDIMGWDAYKYEVFLLHWHKAHEIHILSQRSAFIYSKDYFEFLLPLFFVLCQVDATTKTKVVDQKVVLLTLLCFYLVTDSSLLKQTPTSLSILKAFLEELCSLNLITKDVAVKTNVMLQTFCTYEEIFASDLISESDIELVRNLLISANPLIISKHHAMFYYDNPFKATFLVRKPYPTPAEFFDEMFKISQTISDKFLRALYSDRLHRLMDAQYKKSIFPF